eukprot:7092916-Alexandrium_andersonii.AAC.1
MPNRMCSAAYSARRSAQASGGSCRSRRGGQSSRLRAVSAARIVKQAWSERSRCQLAAASMQPAAAASTRTSRLRPARSPSQHVGWALVGQWPPLHG